MNEAESKLHATESALRATESQVAALTSALEALTRRLSDVEAQQRSPLTPAPRQQPETSPVARRRLFQPQPSEDQQQTASVSAIPAGSSATCTNTTPLPHPSPEVSIGALSADREETFYRDCFLRGEHRPEVYAASLFMALTPFGI